MSPNPNTYPLKATCTPHDEKFDLKAEIWTCCKKRGLRAPGCSMKTYNAHIHADNIKHGVFFEYRDGGEHPVGFVRTEANKGKPLNTVALACEMIYTTGGHEVARVTLVGTDLETLEDTYVKPTNKIVDLNTQFSNIKQPDIDNARETLSSVQKLLKQHIHSETIVVGHSLECDLKALRMIHQKVVDTAVESTEESEDGNKVGQKAMCQKHLGKEMQTGPDGHCSLEDAKASMELILHMRNIRKCKHDVRTSQ